MKAVAASTKAILMYIPYMRGARLQLGLPLAAPKTTCDVYFSNQSRLCGMETSVCGDRAHGFKKKARNHGHNHTRAWWTGPLNSCGDGGNGTVHQRE